MNTFNEKAINWNLDETGVLTVSGEGEIPDCDCGENTSAQWDHVKDMILEIRLMEGITVIGRNAFRNCGNLKKVFLPESLKQIHAYAFYGCKNLRSIESKGRDFRYIYDKTDCFFEDNAIIFGIESFHDTPWSRLRWGEYYIKEECLYVTFAGDSKRLTVPEGVRTLKVFSMGQLDVDSIILPKKLETIENFAFAGSTVEEMMTLPKNIENISDFALADCSITWTDHPLLREVIKKNRKLKHGGKSRIPVLKQRYYLALKSRKVYGDFRQLIIRERILKKSHADMLLSYVIDDNETEDVGKAILRKIKNGKVVLCITYTDDRIISVKSFAFDSRYKMVDEYIMYPHKNHSEDEDSDSDSGNNQHVLSWRDYFTYQADVDIIYAFEDKNGKLLKEKGVLRLTDPGIHEVWFLSNDRDKFGRFLEPDLLEMWLSLNPGLKLNSIRENIENDTYRWPVSV